MVNNLLSNHLLFFLKILKTLKHVPVPNRNELDDSKVESIVQKWSTTPVVVDAVKLNAPKPPERHDSLDDNSNTPSGSDVDGKNDDGGTDSQDESSKEDNENNSEEDKLNKTRESVEEGIKQLCIILDTLSVKYIKIIYSSGYTIL